MRILTHQPGYEHPPLERSRVHCRDRVIYLSDLPKKGGGSASGLDYILYFHGWSLAVEIAALCLGH
jgi:hypothetical protein